MKAYQEASDQITEIERALSLGKKASADTSMRKLQSLMRNNVNTNYGQRMSLAKELEAQGGQMLPALAGQALNTWTPRGLQSASTVPTSLMGYSAGGPGLAAAALLGGSPRLMGEAMHGVGRISGAVSKGGESISRIADKLNVSPTVAANILYQANQAKQ